MYGAKVRLRYAGFVSFLSMLFSVLTGLAFTTIITRKLTPCDFGLWQIISITIAYLSIITNVVYYWAPRFIARGENVAKSSLVYNLVTGIAATIIYIFLSLFISSTLQLEFYYFLFFSPQVFLVYVSMALEGVNRGCAPQHVGYSFMIFELIKVISAYALVVAIKQRLIGAFLSVMLAQLSKVIYLLVVTYPIVKEGVLRKEHLVRFTKLSWIPFYYNLANLMGMLDVYVVTFFAGSTIPVAMFRVAHALSSVILYSTSFSSALYPRVLAKKEKRDIEETIKLSTMFVFPMTAGLIVMAKPLLCIFGVKYLPAYNILLALSATFLVFSFTQIFEAVILGAEEVDLNKKAGFKEYLKSKLFILPTVKYIFHGAYLVLLTVLLAVKAFEVTLTWAITYGLSKILLTVWEYFYSKKIIKYKFLSSSALKYLAASIAMALVLNSLGAGEIIETKIALLLPKVAFYISIGASLYLTLVLLIDEYARNLVKRALSLIKTTSFM